MTRLARSCWPLGPTWAAVAAAALVLVSASSGASPPGVSGADTITTIADTLNHRVREVSLDGKITTFAGGGSDLHGEGVPATSAELFGPYGIAVDGLGNVYLDEVHIRRVSPQGVITTVAGGRGEHGM